VNGLNESKIENGRQREIAKKKTTSRKKDCAQEVQLEENTLGTGEDLHILRGDGLLPFLCAQVRTLLC
jgi:hypothetical protein